MPICTSCTRPTPYLYTVYESAHNLRLEQCTACHAFADPYVEHDTLTLLLDLILLKRDVYRHLLFNRGLGARKVGPAGVYSPSPGVQAGRQADFSSKSQKSVGEQASLARSTEARWLLILKLGTALIVVDTFIRWAYLSSRISFEGSAYPANRTQNVVNATFRVFVGCLVETAAFHAGVICTCYIVLKGLEYAQLRRHQHRSQLSGIRQEFRYSHVPLTLLYSSITKLFLLFLLSIWRPTRTSQVGPHTVQQPNGTTFTHPFLMRALELLDEDKVDREWVIRNVLGGMAAGFGLRVVLDCHPIFTTTIILAGWVMKTAAAAMFAEWAGIGLPEGGGSSEQIWPAYSIP